MARKWTNGLANTFSRDLKAVHWSSKALCHYNTDKIQVRYITRAHVADINTKLQHRRLKTEILSIAIDELAPQPWNLSKFFVLKQFGCDVLHKEPSCHFFVHYIYKFKSVFSINFSIEYEFYTSGNLNGNTTETLSVAPFELYRTRPHLRNEISSFLKPFNEWKICNTL